MKKIMSISLAAILIAVLFVGCASSKAMKDGSYKAEFAEPDDHGWTEFVEVTVTNAKITDVNFDARNEKGDLKSKDPDYKTAMEGAGFKTWPSDFYPKLSAQLIEKQDINQVDSIAGATNSSDSFKKLVKELSKNFSSGKTDLVKVKQ